MDSRKVSFIIPAYNEEESLDELYTQIIENINICKNQNLMNEYEVLFVDDGSTDGTVNARKK